LLFHFLCLSFPPHEKGHQETCVCLHSYMGNDWETLHEEHTIRTLALGANAITWATPTPLGLLFGVFYS
jgi:hypothetical protein